MEAPLAVGRNRLTWPDLPRRLRMEIEVAAGAAVVREVSQPGGFSPGLASVLHLASGSTVFVKAVGAERNAYSPVMYRREAEVLAGLPPAVPAPRLLWTYDDEDWVALMTEAVDGRPPAQPWLAAELGVFLRAAGDLVEVLTPAPLAALTVVELLGDRLTGWRRLAADPAALAGVPTGVAAWVGRELDRLAEVESRWPAAAAGSTLLHGDLRADNVLLTGGGADHTDGVVVVDWPSVCIGAGWVDLLLALPSVAMHGGGDPEVLWRRYPPGRDVDPAAVTSVLTAATGYFLDQSLRPPIPNFPTLRAFQLAQATAGLAWLRRRWPTR